jgi:hypothetical protein
MRIVTILTAGVLAGCAGQQTGDDAGVDLGGANVDLTLAGCAKDTDCKGVRICVRGTCVDPPDGAATPDLARGDEATQVLPDLLEVDRSAPDLAMSPDLAMPDLATPDLAMPDLAMPDLAMPDLAAAPDLTTRTLSFASARFYAAGSGAQVLAVGDLNKDGKPDVVTGSYSPGSLYVLTNTGTGAFNAPTAYASQAYAAAVAVGDLNKDGAADVITGNVDQFGNNFNVSVFLSKGDGTLLARKDYSASPACETFAFALGDYNGDGNLDAATVGQNCGGALAVLLGAGDGTLASTGTAYNGGYPLVAGDWNGDGKLDVAFRGGNNTLVLEYGDGAAHFASNLIQSTPAMFGGGMAATDLNADGKPDLVGVDPGNARVVYVLGSKFDQAMTASVAASPYDVASADFNLDGINDVAVVSGTVNGGTVSILLSAGDGTFKPAVPFATDAGAVAIAAADVDADGKPDIITVSPSRSELAVLLNTTP